MLVSPYPDVITANNNTTTLSGILLTLSVLL